MFVSKYAHQWIRAAVGEEMGWATYTHLPWRPASTLQIPANVSTEQLRSGTMEHLGIHGPLDSNECLAQRRRLAGAYVCRTHELHFFLFAQSLWPNRHGDDDRPFIVLTETKFSIS